MIGVAYYITRQRLRLQRERTDRYLLLAEEANSEYKTLTERMEGQRNTENHLKGLIASRFDIIDKLGKTYYEPREYRITTGRHVPRSETNNHRFCRKQ